MFGIDCYLGTKNGLRYYASTTNTRYMSLSRYALRQIKTLILNEVEQEKFLQMSYIRDWDIPVTDEVNLKSLPRPFLFPLIVLQINQISYIRAFGSFNRQDNLRNEFGGILMLGRPLQINVTQSTPWRKLMLPGVF